MRKSLTACAAVLALSVSSAGFAADSPPTLVWSQTGPVTTGRGEAPNSGNVYYCGGVFDDAFYTGQLNWGPLAFARTQTGDPMTALVRDFDIALLEFPAPGASYNGVRSTVVIGDYVFFNRTNKAAGQVHVNRLNSDWTNLVAFPTDNNGNDVAPEGMTTDGTSLFTTQSTTKNAIRKYSIGNQAGSFSLTKTLDVTVAGAGTFRAISYYNGAIYVVDNGAGNGIYEINASTGTYTRLGTHAGSGAYQVARYGNRLLVVGTDDKLTVYTISDGTLDAGTPYDLGLSDLYGIGVVGTGIEVTGFWVTSVNGWVSFFSCSYSILTCNTPFADADKDQDVDMDDFADFQRCYGPIGPPSPEPGWYPCWCFDTDDSQVLDSTDLNAFAACASGPGVPWVASPACPASD